MGGLLHTVAALALVANHMPKPAPTNSVEPTSFKSAVTIVGTSRVPSLVPARVPLLSRPFLTAHVGPPYAEAGGYDIVIGAIPNCEGAACTFAEINAAPRALNEDERLGQRVTLGNGVAGFYREHPCTAHCGGSSTLDFSFRGARYEISIKAGALSEALAYQRGLKLADRPETALPPKPRLMARPTTPVIQGGRNSYTK